MFKPVSLANFTIGLILVVGVVAAQAQQIASPGEIERNLEISYTSEVLASRSGVAVSVLDLEGRMAGLPEDRRPDALGAPERIAGVLNGVLLTRYLADSAIERGLLSDMSVQAEIYLAAMEILAKKARDQYVEERLLEDYTSQAQEIYLLSPESFKQPEQVTFTHLLLRTDNSNSDASTVEQTARGLLERARNGEAISDLALKYSEDPSIQNNGGFFRDIPTADLDPTFRAGIQELAEGTPEIIESSYGYHVIELNKRSPARLLPFEEVSAQLKEQARADHAKEIFEGFAAQFYEGDLQLSEGAVATIINRYANRQTD